MTDTPRQPAAAATPPRRTERKPRPPTRPVPTRTERAAPEAATAGQTAARPPARRRPKPARSDHGSAEPPEGSRPTTTTPTRTQQRPQRTRTQPRPPPRRTTAPRPAAASDTPQRPRPNRPADATTAPTTATPANHGTPPAHANPQPRTKPRHHPAKQPGRPAETRSDAPHSAPATAWRPAQRGDADGGKAEAGARMRPTAKRGQDSPRRLAPGQRRATQKQRCGRVGCGAAAGRLVMDAWAKWRTGLPVPWRVLTLHRSIPC